MLLARNMPVGIDILSGLVLASNKLRIQNPELMALF